MFWMCSARRDSLPETSLLHFPPPHHLANSRTHSHDNRTTTSTAYMWYEHVLRKCKSESGKLTPANSGGIYDMLQTAFEPNIWACSYARWTTYNLNEVAVVPTSHLTASRAIGQRKQHATRNHEKTMKFTGFSARSLCWGSVQVWLHRLPPQSNTRGVFYATVFRVHNRNIAYRCRICTCKWIRWIMVSIFVWVDCRVDGLIKRYV